MYKSFISITKILIYQIDESKQRFPQEFWIGGGGLKFVFKQNIKPVV